MARTCYLCGKKVVKDKKVSLHKFPTLPHIREKWLDACNLNDKDNVSSLWICSCHFQTKDFTQTPKNSRLNPIAIPSINVPNPDATSKNVTVNGIVKLVNINKLLNAKIEYLPAVPQSVIKDLKVDDLPAISDIKQEDDIQNIQGLSQNVPGKQQFFTSKKCQLTEPLQEIKISDVSTLINEKTRNSSNIVEMAISQELESDAQLLDTAVKRRFAYPRYISEIQEMDFVNPRRRKTTLNFIKAKDKDRLKQIRCLQYENRKLIKQVISMQNMICEKGTLLNDKHKKNMSY